MYVPPPGSDSLKYWKAETEYRQNRVKSGSIILELLTLLWYRIRAVLRLLILLVRLYASWRLRRKQNNNRDPLDWLPGGPNR